MLLRFSNMTPLLLFVKFVLNDTYHQLDIFNKHTKPVTYTFEAQEYGGMETYVTDPEIWGAPRVS